MSGLPAFRKLCALEQLELNRAYPRLLPLLLRRGLAPEDALAVAYNATLLYRVLERTPPFGRPADLLAQYSLDEIAALCETYRRVERGELEYGGRTEP